MHILLDFEIFQWLKQLQLFEEKQSYPIQSGKFQLDEATSKQFENGLKIALLVQKLSHELPQKTPLPSLNMDKLKDSMTPAARVYNWNLLQQGMNVLGLPLDPEIKSLIISGDSEIINEMLKDLHEQVKKIQRNSDNISRTESQVSQKAQRSNKPTNLNEISSQDEYYNHRDQVKQIQMYNYKQQQMKQKQYAEDYEGQHPTQDNVGTVNLELLDVDMPLKRTQSLLEFFLVGISKSLSLQPKQAAALLSNGNKYLAHVLVKGVKSNFETVQDWLQSIYVNLSRVELFIEASEQNITVFLQTIKPSLLSKNEEVALWGCRIYSKLGFDLANLELLPIAYEWFIRENGGLESVILCLKRHSTIAENVVGFLIQMGRYNLTDLFTVQFRKFIKDQGSYLKYCFLMLPYLSEQKLSKEELINGGILDFWLELGFKLSEQDLLKNNQEDRIIGIKMVSEIWIKYSTYVEEQGQLVNQILDVLKRATRDNKFILKMESFVILFKLLDNFASERNPYAAIIYKKLTFSLMENHADINMREILFRNFQMIFQRYKTIPCDVLIEPLVKQIQVSEGQTYFINLCDIEFLSIAADHPKMKLKLSIQLIDLLSKLYLNDQIFAPIIIIPMQSLMRRFIEQEAFQEYTIKLTKISLAMFYTSCKNRKGNRPIFNDFQGDFNEHEIMHSQKRALIIELLKFIINLECRALNDQIKPLIVHIYLQLKEIEQNNKGIITLLNIFGNPQDIVQEILDQQDHAYELKQESVQYDEENAEVQAYLPNNRENLNQSQIMREEDFQNQLDSESQQNLQSSRGSQRSQQSNNEFYKKYEEQQQFEEDDDYNENASQQQNLNTQQTQGFKKTQQNPEEQQQYQTKKMSAASRRTHEQIQKIQNKREAEERQKKLEEEKQIKKKQLMQKKAVQEIQKRNIKLGVESNTQGQEQQQLNNSQIIYAWNELGKQDDNAEENIQVLFEDLDFEEQRDKESISLQLKKYNKAIQYIFNKYNMSTGVQMKNTTFDKLEGKMQTISQADIWKFCRDYELPNNFPINKQYVSNLVKKINMKRLSYNFLNSLNFENFQVFLLNIAYRCFSNEKRDMRFLPMGNLLEELIRFIGQTAKRNGESYSIFQDPDTQLKGTNVDVNQLMMINRQLLKYPTQQIPDIYRKVQEKQQFHQYKYNNKVRQMIGESWVICNEIVNDLLFEKFQISCMEAQCKVEFVIKAKPKQTLPPTSNPKNFARKLESGQSDARFGKYQDTPDNDNYKPNNLIQAGIFSQT